MMVIKFEDCPILGQRYIGIKSFPPPQRSKKRRTQNSKYKWKK